jgi:hypothetical protein
VAYHIQLLKWFSMVHNVFHVTQLKNGMPVPENEVITEANAWIELDFSLIEHPLRVLDRKDRKTRRQTVRIVGVKSAPHAKHTASRISWLHTRGPGVEIRKRASQFSLKLTKDEND